MEYVLFICSLRVCLYCSDYLVTVASQMYITVCMIVQVNKAVDLQRSVKSLNYSLQETLSELLRLKKEIRKVTVSEVKKTQNFVILLFLWLKNQLIVC